jgi:hypothetical protein
MLVIWLLGISYSKKGKIIALAKSIIIKIFFIKLSRTVSSPFAIITDAGKRRNKNSIPLFFGINSAKNNATVRLTIKRIQLFLNELLIEKVFGDFKNSDITEIAIIHTEIQ